MRRKPSILVTWSAAREAGINHEDSFLDGVIRYARRFHPGGYFIRMARPDATDLAAELGASGCDGLLCAIREPARSRALAQSGLPIVNVSAELPEPLPTVCVNDRACGRMGAQALLDRGLEHLAYFGSGESYSRRRQEGFEAACAQSGLSGQIVRAWESIYGNGTTPWHAIDQPALLSPLLRDLPRPLGILAVNDIAAQALVEGCLHLGLLVPEDVAIVGVNNTLRFCELSPVPLTSVDRNIPELGFQAAGMLDAIIDGRDLPSRLILAPPFVVGRQSTAGTSISDKRVAASVAFIREHACAGASVGDVVEAAGISRRSLEMRFRKATGRSIGEHIRREKLRQVSHLLRQTDLPLVEIAVLSGYESVTYLTRAFKAAVGQTPSAYRRSGKGIA